jgi:hypothetical protein
MTNQQLELGFGGERLAAQNGRSERRVSRAQWWFAHMRRIVDRAMDWQAAGEPRPEQIWFAGAQRQAQV